MASPILSLRAFIGSKDYMISREFYRTLGFTETVVGEKMCVFRREGFSFYLQNEYSKEWVENTMLFLEVDDVDAWLAEVKALNLTGRFGVRLSEIVKNDWGSEFFLHDPAGVLWHIGTFK